MKCTIDIPGGSSLTIAPGAILKFGTAEEISVEGTLDAVGTASSPIIFTSVNDNSVGGTTGSGSPAAGDWQGISISGAGSVDLEHAHVSYAVAGVGTASLNEENTGTQVIEYDTFASVGGAVELSIDGPAATVEDNTASAVTGSSAYAVSSDNLNFGLINGNSATSTTTGAQFYVGGTVGSSSTMVNQAIPWVAYVLDVPVGETLTVAAGAVLKGDSLGGEISVEGTLDAVGTASSPIIFTSVNDNSVGGTTGSGSPAAGDWQGISISGAGSVDLEHAHVSYAVAGVGTASLNEENTGTQVIEYDTFASVGGAVELSIDGPAATVEDNTASAVTGSSAYAVSSDNLNFGLINGNSATSTTTGAQFYVGGTVGSSSTMVNQAIPWVAYVLDVPVGETLTVAAGAVLKGDSLGGEISVEGTLDAVGTVSSPIIFTSVNDNSVGGTTGSGSPAAGDWQGISISGAGSVDLEHAHVSYAVAGVGTASLNEENTGTQVIEYDTFASVGGAVELSIDGPAATVEDNTASAVTGSSAYAVSSDNLNFGLINGNSATSTTTGAQFYVGGTVGSSSTMVNQAIPWVIGTTLDVPEGETLGIMPGTIVKGGSDPGMLTVEGSLSAEGTASSPIVFTSVNDSAVGGTTGSGSPAVGDWQGIEIGTANDNVTISNVVFKYASTAIGINELDALTVNQTEFSYNSAAFAVGSTPITSILLGQVDCAPPYTSYVTGTGDWFGSTGIPGTSFDFGSLGGDIVPAGFSKVWSLISVLIPTNGSVSDNTIPWGAWQCPEDFEIPIPVTPIAVQIAGTAPFPGQAYLEK